MNREIDAGKLADEITSRIAQMPSRTTPRVREVRREYSRLLRDSPADVVIQIAFHLVDRGDVICRFVGYEIVKEHKTAFESLTCKEVVELGRGIDSWGAVDCFACYLSGPAWRDGRLSDATIRRWTQSKNRWFRRAALVSTVELSRQGDLKDVGRILEICSLLADDQDDIVVKALSWALRELAKKHPNEALRFLEVKRDRLAARVKREVQNKIATGLKNPDR